MSCIVALPSGRQQRQRPHPGAAMLGSSLSTRGGLYSRASISMASWMQSAATRTDKTARRLHDQIFHRGRQKKLSCPALHGLPAQSSPFFPSQK